MQGYRTTFRGMFTAQPDGGLAITSVSIPLIQRDYAQGRETTKANKIRDTFLDALRDALTTCAPVGLDFIYGKVADGVFEPLDGQQRLTTLFLLHWYVAQRSGNLDVSEPWTQLAGRAPADMTSRFTYATRPGARLFCERLVAHSPLAGDERAPSAWVKDQPWYLHVWRFDPTIRAMLVTLDAIHERFAGDDTAALWKRLCDDDHPAIWFQLLPIDDMGSPENLYIKMNSRGKPLTDFEAFKSHLGELVGKACHDAREVDLPDSVHEFGHRIDGAWTDLFWPYRGDNDVVDDELMRYFEFLIEICEWRESRASDSSRRSPEQRVSALLGHGNQRRFEHLRFLCEGFQCWVDPYKSIDAVFTELFSITPQMSSVRLFGASTPNLFASACEKYGALRGTVRQFSLTDTLLLFAVLSHRMHGTAEPEARLRVLRNVNEASQFELRLQNMPAFLGDVEAFMASGDLACLKTFNTNQVMEEGAKRSLVANMPEVAQSLHRLEDHPILRGTLAAFDLDATIVERGRAFEEVMEPGLWSLLTGALAASGEYQRDYKDSDYHRFGSPTTESVWRGVFVDRGDRESLASTREALAALLDHVSSLEGETQAILAGICESFLADREASGVRDWRYYLVRYPVMREGNSGIYYGTDGQLGYEMTMLRKTVQRSWYRDPYLYAIWCEARQPEEVKNPWFYGYSTTPRWMLLPGSGTEIRSVSGGLVIRTEAEGSKRDTVAEVCVNAGAAAVGEEWLLGMNQTDVDGMMVDNIDRVQRGTALVVDLLAAGL